MTLASSNVSSCALVVADDPMVRKAAVNILEEAEVITLEAASGEKALLVF